MLGFRARRQARDRSNGMIAAIKLWAGYGENSGTLNKTFSVAFADDKLWRELVTCAKRAEGYGRASDHLGVEAAYIQARKIVDAL